MSLFSAKQTIKLDVEGMHCEKCVARVTEALSNAEGVTNAVVDLASNSAVVEGRGMDGAQLAAVVSELGFPTKEAQE